MEEAAEELQRQRDVKPAREKRLRQRDAASLERSDVSELEAKLQKETKDLADVENTRPLNEPERMDIFSQTKVHSYLFPPRSYVVGVSDLPLFCCLYTILSEC